MKKTILTLSSFAFLILTACSDDVPQVSEKLRKIGDPINGVWHVTDLQACEAGKQKATITITDTSIEKHSINSDIKSLILTEMIKTKSSKYIILSGKAGKDQIPKFESLAYTDQGDKLEFAGFFINNKLVNRGNILENYNADGNALQNLKNYDYLFCGNL